MAITAKLYAPYVAKVNNKEIDFDTDTIKVALATSSYTPSQTTHDYFNDITNELTTASGYTAGGATIASKTVTLATLTQQFDAADTSWTFSALVTFRYAIVYVSTGTSSTSPLIGYIDFGADQTPNGVVYTIQWAATGIFTGTVA